MSESVRSIAAAEMDRWFAAVAACRFHGDDPDTDLLSLLASAERLKNACAALQARATHEYSERRLATLTVGSKPDRDTRRDIAATIARARRVSPTHGTRYLELARMLVRDLPHTLHALATGHTTEYRASLIAHSAACLRTADRAALDADLGPRLTGQGNRAVQAEADRIASELDAPAVVERHRLAAEDRRVTLRPAPDTMTYLTALLPVADGVATWAALDRHATLAKAGGDRRSRGQLMADELRHRLLTGTASPQPDAEPKPETPGPAVVPPGRRAPAGEPIARTPHPRPKGREGDNSDSTPSASDRPSEGRPDVPNARPDPAGPGRGIRTSDTDSPPIEVPADPAMTDPPTVQEGGPDHPPTPAQDTAPTRQTPPVPPVRQIDLMLVMTDRALLNRADTAAVIPGHGPIPAALAREMLADADPATRIFIRRLYTDPTGHQLLSADARGRLFPHAVRQFVLARDHRCRTPYCDATIRHIDHTVPHSTGGPTTLANTDGLCEQCSLRKAARTDTEVQPGPPPRPPRSAPWGLPTDTAVGAP